jgi:CheY-like chemotaxis protein
LNRRHGGAGLGLAIAKSLTEAMGGHITGQSDVGIGSSFSVRLPLERGGSAMDAAVYARKGVQGASQATILLVEDNEANILIARHFLDEFGYGHDVAMTGEEALAKVTGGAQYQVILMDIQMPGMDGMETTRRIRAFEREQGLPPRPIIAMTANAMLTDREQCIDAGMDSYVTKPFDPETLKSILTDHLRASSFQAEPESE